MAHDGSEPDYLGFDYPHTSADGQFALFATAATNLVPYDTEPNSVVDVFRAANPLAAPDQDGDGLPDSLEDAGCTDSLDADSDDDGLADGSEDANWNGTQDAGETEPCDADSDDDGVEDGTEDGRNTVAFELDLDGPIAGTDPSAFTPDSDPFTTTASLDPDSDGDGALDGAGQFTASDVDGLPEWSRCRLDVFDGNSPTRLFQRYLPIANHNEVDYGFTMVAVDIFSEQIQVAVEAGDEYGFDCNWSAGPDDGSQLNASVSGYLVDLE